jgi:hypothetical protein
MPKSAALRLGSGPRDEVALHSAGNEAEEERRPPVPELLAAVEPRYGDRRDDPPLRSATPPASSSRSLPIIAVQPSRLVSHRRGGLMDHETELGWVGI